MTATKRLTEIVTVVVAAMITAGIVGALLSFCCFTATSGQADFTTLFVLGFTMLFIGVYSKALFGSSCGYLVSVLLPAVLWVGIHMLVTNRPLSPRMMYNSSASFVIVSAIYYVSVLISKRKQKPSDESEGDQQSEPL